MIDMEKVQVRRLKIAHVTTPRPQIEIFVEDDKCSHCGKKK